MNKEEPQSYEFKFGILGHEIFNIELKTTSTHDRWVAVSILTIFCVLTVMGAYGDKFIKLFEYLTGT